MNLHGKKNNCSHLLRLAEELSAMWGHFSEYNMYNSHITFLILVY
jgi:hypothetical protein